jgi:PKD repeat protein
MRKLLLAVPLLVAVAVGCKDGAPTGPGVVKVTETTTSTTTTSTSTSTSTTSTIPEKTLADFDFTPQTPEVLQVVFFTSISKPGTGRTIVRYAWDFGDGSLIKTGSTATHDYTVSGTYLVALTVTDNAGDTNRKASPITIRPALPPQ